MPAYNKDKPETIQSMFDNIANDYDRTNAVLSFYMHHLWNAALVKHTVTPNNPKTLVDLCAGTGEIAFRSIKTTPSLEKVTLIDFSQEMLACAKEKAKKSTSTPEVSYIQANVENIPLPNNSVDCMTMAYGIRNVKNPIKCLQEVHRTLQPGGTFGILELTRPTNRLLKTGHNLYLKTILPILGKWLTSDEAAYTYLCQSIHSFVKPNELKQKLIDSGFQNLHIKPLAGGIATLFIAKKS